MGDAASNRRGRHVSPLDMHVNEHASYRGQLKTISDK